MRFMLGMCLFATAACTIAWAADPAQDAIDLVEKYKGKIQPKNAKKILSVDLARKNVTDKDLAVLGAVGSIRHLSLGAETMKDKKGKTIYKPSKITDDGLKKLAGLTELQRLELDGANITDAGLKHLAELKNLTELVLSGTKVTDEGMEELKKLPKLQTLVLYDTKVTDTGVSLLKRWKLELNIAR